MSDIYNLLHRFYLNKYRNTLDNYELIFDGINNITIYLNKNQIQLLIFEDLGIIVKSNSLHIHWALYFHKDTKYIEEFKKYKLTSSYLNENDLIKFDKDVLFINELEPSTNISEYLVISINKFKELMNNELNISISNY